MPIRTFFVKKKLFVFFYCSLFAIMRAIPPQETPDFCIIFFMPVLSIIVEFFVEWKKYMTYAQLYDIYVSYYYFLFFNNTPERLKIIKHKNIPDSTRCI